MAKFELKFIDVDFIERYIKTNVSGLNNNLISISGKDDNNIFEIWLDKSTAIKFAKTLRTEINKITESEVNNG
jgi:hypothetical protein